jgi:ABC-type Fe3+/spermidine/putrescine transport system ATPase subunit
MVDMELRGITKLFGSTTAVDSLDLAVPSGKLTCLLGPSGCGKTTTLRILAGFIDPDEGEILIGGKSQVGIPPNRRPTSLVFQDYALFPHLRVDQNVGFGLRRQRLSRESYSQRVAEAMERVGLEGLGARFPGELSGGEQQRVALARSLVLEPSVILMDEPLSNLDAKIRVALRSQLKTIQSELDATILYVTHDQEEALSLGDQIAVMESGRIRQVDSPKRIYHQPKDRFVAEFIGMTDWLEGTCISRQKDRVILDTGSHKIIATCQDDSLQPGEPSMVSVRPQHLEIVPSQPADRENVIEADVQSRHFHGAYERIVTRYRGAPLVIDVHAGSIGALPSRVNLSFSPESALAFAARAVPAGAEASAPVER